MRTIAGLFDDADAAKSAVAKLRNMGISSDDISVVSSDSNDFGTVLDSVETVTVSAGLGAAGGGALGLAAGIGLMSAPALGPLAVVGWLASLLAGASAGVVAGSTVGGLIDAFTHTGVREEDAHVYAECIGRGGSLVAVRVGGDRFKETHEVLTQSGMIDTAAWRRKQTAGT